MADQRESVEQLINSNPDWFEQVVLGCLMLYPDFYSKCSRVLCVDPKNGKFTPDFSQDIDNALYKALGQYKLCVGGDAPPMSREFAQVILTQMAQQADQIGLDEVDQALDRMSSILSEVAGEVALSVASAGVEYWLKKSRAARALRLSTSKQNWDPDEVLSSVRFQTDAVTTMGKENPRRAFGAGIDAEKLNVVRIPCNLANLNKALGGGFGKKEAYLVVAASGAGKTVFATQLASDFAYNGYKGVLITTEQPQDELEVRCISNYANVPFDLIKDEFKPELLSQEQLSRYLEFREKASPNFHILEWLEDRSKSILVDLDEEIRKAKEDMGGLDWMIFDWIGGALGKLVAADSSQIRFIYQLTADKMPELARAHNITVVALAQGHPTLATNKQRVDASTIAECKSMHRNMTGGIGITAMFEEQNVAAIGGRPTFSERQGFYIFKARKSEGGFIPFRRQFRFQRMIGL